MQSIRIDDLKTIEDDPFYFSQLKKSRINRPPSSIKAQNSSDARRSLSKSSYTIIQQIADKTQNYPAPGEYDVCKSFKAIQPFPHASLSKTSHIAPDSKSTVTPGPQSYQTPENLSTLSKTGGYMSVFKPQDKPNHLNGPGSYEMRSKIDINRGKFQDYRGSQQKYDSSPGPDYRIQNHYMGSSFSFIPKRQQQPNQYPAPNAYDVTGHWKRDSRFKNVEGFKFSQYNPIEKVGNENPGPGEYYKLTKPSPPAGLAWQFGARCYRE